MDKALAWQSFPLNRKKTRLGRDSFLEDALKMLNMKELKCTV